jgi:hypothetical protein
MWSSASGNGVRRAMRCGISRVSAMIRNLEA